MNPDRIWRELGSNALARQATASSYGVFVAMPFRNQFSYRSDDVFTDIVAPAVARANTLNPPRQFFSPPLRADRLASSAGEITEEIVEHIVSDHFFIADLTLANHGVLVEVGVALALKPLRQIVLIAQGDLSDLHFDIKDNRVVAYDRGQPVDDIARALIDGAAGFEAALGMRMETIRRSLSPNAVYLLNLYGRFRRDRPGFSLHAGVSDDPNLSKDPAVRELAFNSAVEELLARGLLETDYRVADDGKAEDMYGLHATELGLVFIRQTWPNAFGGLR
jgi:hypothetical protein